MAMEMEMATPKVLKMPKMETAIPMAMEMATPKVLKVPKAETATLMATEGAESGDGEGEGGTDNTEGTENEIGGGD
eukprot:Nitzschia sp. Nitz4//scaffold450_size6464//5255//5568//NITZ4_009176-RA/size6464-exonerate_est2genome-gene-0.5-mRNA-1//-1//CDS//3329552260//9169//frame0